jgi:hypothetical protein
MGSAVPRRRARAGDPRHTPMRAIDLATVSEDLPLDPTGKKTGGAEAPPA